MTRDDVIRMAREVGLSHFIDSEGQCTGVTDAKLIDADKERNDDRLVEILASFANRCEAAGAAAEREACAKVCEDIATKIYGMTKLREYGECADAIRARGEK